MKTWKTQGPTLVGTFMGWKRDWWTSNRVFRQTGKQEECSILSTNLLAHLLTYGQGEEVPKLLIIIFTYISDTPLHGSSYLVVLTIMTIIGVKICSEINGKSSRVNVYHQKKKEKIYSPKMNIGSSYHWFVKFLRHRIRNSCFETKIWDEWTFGYRFVTSISLYVRVHDLVDQPFCLW